MDINMDNINDILSSLSDEDMENLRAAAENLFSSEEKTDKKENKGDNSAEQDSQTVEVVPQLSVSEFFAEDSFSIDYASYTLCQSYPETVGEDFFMAMDATEGHQLCVVKFSVENMSASEQELNMLNKQGRYSLRIDGGKIVQAQSTLLMDEKFREKLKNAKNPKEFIKYMGLRFKKAKLHSWAKERYVDAENRAEQNFHAHFDIKRRMEYYIDKYVPYFAEIDDNVDIHGGVYYTKAKELSEISYKAWQNQFDYAGYCFCKV